MLWLFSYNFKLVVKLFFNHSSPFLLHVSYGNFCYALSFQLNNKA